MKIQGKKGVRELRISIKKRMDDGKTIQMEKEFRKRTLKIIYHIYLRKCSTRPLVEKGSTRLQIGHLVSRLPARLKLHTIPILYFT